MRRKCTEKLLQWKKNPKRKPLVLTGGRQTGENLASPGIREEKLRKCHLYQSGNRASGGRFPQQPQRCRGDPSVPGILREQTPAPGQNTC